MLTRVAGFIGAGLVCLGLGGITGYSLVMCWVGP